MYGNVDKWTIRWMACGMQLGVFMHEWIVGWMYGVPLDGFGLAQMPLNGCAQLDGWVDSVRMDAI
jgi:hypothetical protein